MKTNQIMIRQLGEFNVKQRTKDGFFNATDLIKQWNEAKGMKKEINDYLSNKSTEEFIEELIKEESLDRGNYPYVKSRASRGDNAGTWMHPLLFLDFAMWLNPRFKVKVLKFVQDEMIRFRHLAGESYPTMCKAVRTLFTDDKAFKKKIQVLARSLNIIVYGKHEHEMRNKVAKESKIRELYELQSRITEWIDLNLVKNYDDLKGALQRFYNNKYPNTLPL